MSWGTNVLVGQSGGPTAVINSSLAGVYARQRGRQVLGSSFATTVEAASIR